MDLRNTFTPKDRIEKTKQNKTKQKQNKTKETLYFSYFLPSQLYFPLVFHLKVYYIFFYLFLVLNFVI